jgi:hypothetical protein
MKINKFEYTLGLVEEIKQLERLAMYLGKNKDLDTEESAFGIGVCDFDSAMREMWDRTDELLYG